MVDNQQPGGFTVRVNQPLIGVILKEHGREVVRYFSEEDEADAAIPQQAAVDAIKVAGSWSDLDWEKMEATLEGIRHEVPPTPPIEV